jgi:purine-binding chemotaxis protein CheW
MSVDNVRVSSFDDEAMYGGASSHTVENSRNYLIFLIDDLKLGVDAAHVVEILTNQLITYLPMVPHYVQGIFNMRGQIIPVMDIRARMGKPALEGDRLLIVLNYQNSQLGIFVDAVDQMIEIPTSAIHPMPAQNSQILVSEMCTIPDGSGTMLVLDCDQVFSHE